MVHITPLYQMAGEMTELPRPPQPQGLGIGRWPPRACHLPGCRHFRNSGQANTRGRKDDIVRGLTPLGVPELCRQLAHWDRDKAACMKGSHTSVLDTTHDPLAHGGLATVQLAFHSHSCRRSPRVGCCPGSLCGCGPGLLTGNGTSCTPSAVLLATGCGSGGKEASEGAALDLFSTSGWKPGSQDFPVKWSRCRMPCVGGRKGCICSLQNQSVFVKSLR